jgi:alpha-glucosidase
MTFRFYTQLVPILALSSCALWASSEQVLSTLSPNGEIEFRLRLDEGMLSYEIEHAGVPIVSRSALGFVLDDDRLLQGNLSLQDVETHSVDEGWSQPWGEVSYVRDNHQEMAVRLATTGEEPLQMTLRVRVFDEGVGFRYEWPAQAHLQEFQILDEITQFNIVGEADVWWTPAYLRNRYEQLTQQSTLGELRDIPGLRAVDTPLTMKLANGRYVSIHEAALTDFAGMTLAPIPAGGLEADLVPWADGIKVKASAPHVSPWRTLMISPRLGDLVESLMILNLNEPSKLDADDLSWIEPGIYAGIWWGIHIRQFTHWPSEPQDHRLGRGATTANAMRYIDFAVEHGFKGVLVEGWNKGWVPGWQQSAAEFNFLEANEEYDLESLAQYALARGTRLIAHHETGLAIPNYEAQLLEALDLCERLGIRVIKTGYVGANPSAVHHDEQGELVGLEWQHGQYMVRHFRRVVEEAAKRKISLIVHEPIKDTGIRRTWPNMVSREGARGQEFNAWDKEGGNPPDHTTLLPYTRMLSGPMDFTPGVLDVTFDQYKPNNRINTTLAKQLALYIVLYSPFHLATDLPENYEGHPAFEFVKNVATDWSRTLFIDGEIGEHATIARKKRGSEEWFVGSVTNAERRQVALPLDFLEPGMIYEARIYADGPDADWETKPKSYVISTIRVDANSVLDVQLAPGGGQAIHLKPIDSMPRR